MFVKEPKILLYKFLLRFVVCFVFGFFLLLFLLYTVSKSKKEIRDTGYSRPKNRLDGNLGIGRQTGRHNCYVGNE